MDLIIANVDHIEFKIERDLNEQFGALPLPFPGMDSKFRVMFTWQNTFPWFKNCSAESTAAVCQFFNRNDGAECMAVSCPFRHIRGDRTIVCKHWLRGLCKKGDQCEFLHEYDMTKMPECYFYSRFNACHNKECPFLHIDPESKIKDCPWYDRGFCRHGPHCRWVGFSDVIFLCLIGQIYIAIVFVDIVTSVECCVQIIWPACVRMENCASICIHDSNYHPHRRYQKIKLNGHRLVISAVNWVIKLYIVRRCRRR